VSLDWPTWGLDFEDVEARGSLHLGGVEGLRFAADLTAGASVGRLPRHGTTVADRVAIRGFRWQDQGFAVDAVRLVRGDGASVEAAGRMGFRDVVTLEARGKATLTTASAPGLLADRAPDGLAVEGIEVHIDGEGLRAGTTRVSIPIVSAGPARLEDVAFAASGSLRPRGLFGPGFGVLVEDLRAARIEVGAAATVRGVSVARIAARGGSAIEAELEGGRAERVLLPGGEVPAVAARAKVDGTLAGVTADADVETPQGRIRAEGRLEVKLLGGERVPVDVTLTDLEGALAATLLDAVPDDVQTLLIPPISGRASFLGRIDDRRIGFSLESGEIVGSGRAVYREGAWALAGTAPSGGPGAIP
jgi:hypothetical protein